VPTFVDRGVSRGQRGGSPMVVNLSFVDRLVTEYRTKMQSSEACFSKIHFTFGLLTRESFVSEDTTGAVLFMEEVFTNEK
jgi:hypothetical protein